MMTRRCLTFSLSPQLLSQTCSFQLLHWTPSERLTCTRLLAVVSAFYEHHLVNPLLHFKTYLEQPVFACCAGSLLPDLILPPLFCSPAACIDMWLKKDPSCPLCKRPLYKPSLRHKPTPGANHNLAGHETGLGQASAQDVSSTGADDGQTSTATDLEAGPNSTTQSGLATREVHERAEEDERAHRQRPTNPAWYLHQWLGWGW